MKIKFLFAFIFLVQSTLGSWTNAVAATRSESVISTSVLMESSHYKQMDLFLKQMGFEDFSAEIDKTLQGGNLDNQQKEILKSNQERLQMLNAAREIGAFMADQVSDQILTNDFTQDRMFQLIAKLLTSGPRGLPDELPPEVQNIKDPKEKMAQAEKFIQAALEDSANQSLLEMKADFLSALYRNEEILQLEKSQDAKYLAVKKFLTDRLAAIAIAQHSFLELAQTKFLGRALALTTVKQLRSANQVHLENELRVKVAKSGASLDNEVSAKYVRVYTKGEDEKLLNLSLKNGDLLTSYNRGLEAEQSVVRIYPTSWVARLVQFARLKLGIQHMKVLIPWTEQINAKRLKGLKLGILEKIVLFSSNLPIYRRGFNAVGVVEVKKDAASGLETAWIFRNIGNSQLGGIQVEDAHNFLMPGLTDRIGHTRLNADAVVKFNKQKGFESQVSLDSEQTSRVNSQVSEADRNQLLAQTETQSQFENGIAQKAIEMMKKMMTGPEVVGNDWGAKARQKLLSGAQSVWLAFKAGAGMDIQTQSQSVTLNRNAQPQDRADVKGVRAISPSTWLWDSSLSKTTSLSLPPATAEARTIDMYGATRGAIDPKTYALTSIGQDRISLKEGNLKYVSGWTMNTGEMKELMASSPTAERKDQWNNIERIESGLTQIPSDNLISEKSMRSFLFDLGFDDRAKSIQQAFSRGDTENTSTKVQQERNVKSYEALISARELSILLMSELQGRLQNDSGQKQVAELAAYLLSLQPQFPAKKLPNEILALPKHQQEAAKDKYTKDLLRKTMDQHTRTITSDLLWNILGDEALAKIENKTADKALVDRAAALTQRIYQLSSGLVERMYMDNLTGQTRYAGRAFSALVARQAEVRNTPKLMEYTNQAAHRYGYNIQNFIGTEWVFNEPGSNASKKVKVSNLSMVLNRDMGPNGAIIPSGAIPHDSLIADAKKNGLVSKFGLLSAANAMFSNSLDSLKDGYSRWEKTKDQLAYNTLSDGFSHIGYVAIKEAKGSNVKMTWIYDNYPTLLADHEVDVEGAKYNAGGLRFSGLEQFYMTSIQSRFMVANPDPKEFYDQVQKYIKQNGKPKTGDEKFPFKMYASKIDENGKPIIQKESEAIRATWPVTTKQETLDRIFSITDPQQFYNEYTRLVMEGFDKEITRGMTFQWITPYGLYEKGAGYCSSTLVLMATKMFGLNPELLPGKWHPLLGVVKKVFDWAEKKKLMSASLRKTILDTGLITMAKMGIIPPSSLASQKYMTGHTNVQSPAQEISARMKDDYSMRVAKSRVARGVVDKSLRIHETNFFAGMKFDGSEVRTISMLTEEGVDARLGKVRATLEAIKNIATLGKKMPVKDLLLKDAESKNQKDQPQTDRVSAAMMCRQVFAN